MAEVAKPEVNTRRLAPLVDIITTFCSTYGQYAHDKAKQLEAWTNFLKELQELLGKITGKKNGVETFHIWDAVGIMTPKEQEHLSSIIQSALPSLFPSTFDPKLRAFKHHLSQAASGHAYRLHRPLWPKGSTAEQLRIKGHSASELYHAGFTAKELHEGGFTPYDLRTMNVSVKELFACGYSARDICRAGFCGPQVTPKSLLAAGYPPAEVVAAGFRFPAKDMKGAGFTATDLVGAGYTAKDLKLGSFTMEEMAACFTASELEAVARLKSPRKGAKSPRKGDSRASTPGTGSRVSSPAKTVRESSPLKKTR
eukprot:jgi/Mesvir1/4323/Mv16257-RA.1